MKLSRNLFITWVLCMLQAVSAGLALADNGEEASWKTQLLQVKKELSQFQSEMKKVRGREAQPTRRRVRSRELRIREVIRSPTTEANLARRKHPARNEIIGR